MGVDLPNATNQSADEAQRSGPAAAVRLAGGTPARAEARVLLVFNAPSSSQPSVNVDHINVDH